ncbi:MAG: T9SS type A sorting domain-containing protein [Ignavibacteria bacterium]|jgi:hypothetical protein
MKSLKRIALLTIFIGSVFAQTVYELPFASEGNVIELSVANTSDQENFTGKIEINSQPGWIKFSQNNYSFDEILSGEESTAVFEFDVDEEAPVNNEAEIVFGILGKDNQQWQKTIKVTVLPPDNFELFQNYPNPFNPSTIISYQLPEEGKVTLKIYNILGEQVKELVNETKKPGLHKVNWNASNLASGMYVYSIYAELNNGEKQLQKKKMLLVK